jgi:hypothetical protein|mmetsp:Transcript_7844/g.19439  ORF Transcript_7844/g.19439 Transcript_7844/m.19439 type:complete len:186 (+) Transcript_7844:148-705(+)
MSAAGANVVVGAGAGLVAGAGGPGAGASAAAPLAAAAPKLRLPDVTSVVLDDEENVFLTPKEVRAEISELKRRYKFSNGDFAVACGVAKGAQPGAPIGRFLAATGDFGGEQMDVYRPAAQFIEKMRVFEERPKSKKRKDLEADSEGRPGKKVFLGLNPSTKYLVMAGTYMTKDSLGRNVHGHPGW